VFVCIYICMHVYSCMHVCVYMHVCMYTPIDLMRALLFTSVPLNGALARTTKGTLAKTSARIIDHHAIPSMRAIHVF